MAIYLTQMIILRVNYFILFFYILLIFYILEVNGDINNFEQSNGDVPHQLSNGISNLTLNNKSNSNMDNSSTAANTISQPPAEEPESIKRWREQHLKNLEAKDKEEKTKIDEHREQAKKELEEWYQRYKDQLSKTKKQNR